MRRPGEREMKHTIVTVCAWCQRYLGTSAGGDKPGLVSHGICPACMARQRWTEAPTLVVSRSREDWVPVLRDLLRGAPEIHLILDRRSGDRRSGQIRDLSRRERRGGPDRRRGAVLLIV